MGTSKNKTYASALAFRSALDERARRSQRDTGESLQLVGRRYAFEAFLRRIPRSDQPLVLKGGYLMQLRYAEGTRLTKDLDVSFAVRVSYIEHCAIKCLGIRADCRLSRQPKKWARTRAAG